MSRYSSILLFFITIVRVEAVTLTLPKEILGISGHPTTKGVYLGDGAITLSQQIDLIKGMNASWYRIDVHGDKDLDSLIPIARPKGVNLLPVFSAGFINRDLAQGDSPQTAYQKARALAFATVNQYKKEIHAWELANEEDVFSLVRKGRLAPQKNGNPAACFAEDKITWTCGDTRGTALDDYSPQPLGLTLAILKGLADGVRAADPEALRVINSAGFTHTGFFQHLEDNHVPYEIVGIHWYSEMGDLTCAGSALPCPATSSELNVVQTLQKITKGKRMWITEMNYAKDSDPNSQNEYLMATLKNYLQHSEKYPFDKIFIYELLDEPNKNGTEAHFGLVNVSRQRSGQYQVESMKPAYRFIKSL